MSNQIFEWFSPLLAGLAIASALIDISQQKPSDSKDKTSGVRNRKHHLSTRQGTCVWETETAPGCSEMFWFCKWLPLRLVHGLSFYGGESLYGPRAQVQFPPNGQWPKWPENVRDFYESNSIDGHGR